MDEAFDWIRKYIWDEEVRQMLLAYAEVKARGWDWSRYLNNRNRRNPKKTAWVERTVQRLIFKSLQVTEVNLLKSDLILRDGAALLVFHDEAKHRGKSITSGDLRERVIPDGEQPSVAA